MGVNGAYEASYHGVPVVAAPVVADGYETAIRLCKKGSMAKFIDIYTADVDAWLKIINEVLYNTE